LVPRSTESLRGGASRYAGEHAASPLPGDLGGWKPPRNIRGHGRRQPPPVKTISWIQNQDFGTRIWYFLFNQYEIWSELGPYGSVAHIKTGKRYMYASGSFKNLPGPKKGHGMPRKMRKKIYRIV